MITLLKLRPYTGDIVAPSPNHDARKTQAIQGIVLHATADAGDEPRTLAWLRSSKSRVSCHLLVSRAGWVTRLVGDRERAWHAGASWWRGQTDVNSITLGIEIANRNDGEPFTDAQYSQVAKIVAHYCRQGMSLDDVVSHREIAPGRRTDPLGWDWDRFRAMVQQQLKAVEIPLPSLPIARAPQSGGPVVAAAPTMQPVSATARSKPAMRSRTLWLNGLTALAAGVAIAGQTVELAFRVGFSVPKELTTWALFLVGVVNIILRFRTTGPVTCPVEPAALPRDQREQTSGESAPAVPSGRGVLPICA